MLAGDGNDVPLERCARSHPAQAKVDTGGLARTPERHVIGIVITRVRLSKCAQKDLASVPRHVAIKLSAWATDVAVRGTHRAITSGSSFAATQKVENRSGTIR